MFFLIANGLEVISYIFNYQGMYMKKELIMNSFVCFSGLLYLLINSSINLRSMIYLLLFMVIAVFFSFVDMYFGMKLSDMRFIGVFYSIFILIILSEYFKFYHEYLFKIFCNVVNLIAFLLILKLLFNVSDIWNLFNPVGFKSITFLPFVNMFAYICSFAIISYFFYYQNYNNLKVKKVSLQSIFFILLNVIFCLFYLIMAKSKGAIFLTIIGPLLIYMSHMKVINIFTILFFFIPSICILILFDPNDTFINSLLLYGRTVDESSLVQEKIAAMFSNRFVLSEFLSGPLNFLYQNFFGVGWDVATKKDVTTNVGIHSLIILLIEAYGFISILFFTAVLSFVKYKLKLKYLLPTIMILVPGLLTNQIYLMYVIPLLIMSYYKFNISFLNK